MYNLECIIVDKAFIYRYMKSIGKKQTFVSNVTVFMRLVGFIDLATEKGDEVELSPYIFDFVITEKFLLFSS